MVNGLGERNCCSDYAREWYAAPNRSGAKYRLSAIGHADPTTMLLRPARRVSPSSQDGSGRPWSRCVRPIAEKDQHIVAEESDRACLRVWRRSRFDLRRIGEPDGGAAVCGHFKEICLAVDGCCEDQRFTAGPPGGVLTTFETQLPQCAYRLRFRAVGPTPFRRRRGGLSDTVLDLEPCGDTGAVNDAGSASNAPEGDLEVAGNGIESDLPGWQIDAV